MSLDLKYLFILMIEGRRRVSKMSYKEGDPLLGNGSEGEGRGFTGVSKQIKYLVRGLLERDTPSVSLIYIHHAQPSFSIYYSTSCTIPLLFLLYDFLCSFLTSSSSSFICIHVHLWLVSRLTVQTTTGKHIIKEEYTMSNQVLPK